MQYVTIPNTDLNVSRVALGTWSIGGSWWGGSDDQQSIAAIQRALDAGINLLDTAPVYGDGHAEKVVGNALQGRDRSKVIIATKCGLEIIPGGVRRNSSRQRILNELDDSLRRLRTDYIDIYQVHWPDTTVPLAETGAFLDDLRKQGKIRAVGVSNFSPAQMEEFRQGGPIHTIQPPYNLFERLIEMDALPYARQNRLAVLAYGPLCRGLLSGRMTAETKFNGDDLRGGMDPKFQQPRFGQYLNAVAKLDDFARKAYDKNVLSLAMRWVLDQDPLMIALWGARKPEQLDPLPEFFDWKLDIAALKEVDAIIARTVTDPVGPEFLAPPEGSLTH